MDEPAKKGDLAGEAGGWQVSEVEGEVGALLASTRPAATFPSSAIGSRRARAKGPAAITERSLRWCRAVRRAIVLGSTQPEGTVDPARAAASGLSVARRQSGGGAVLVGPDEVLWAELSLPPWDPLWDPDVGRSAWWLGQTWASALVELDQRSIDVHRGPMLRTAWSELVCFSGLAPGEVLAGGRKVVGIAQRRGRWGSQLQCAVLLRWDPEALVDALALAPGERRRAAVDLADAATPAGVGPRALAAAFTRNLP